MPNKQTGNKLGANRANQILDNVLSRGEEMQENILRKLMADGRPPLTEVVDERELLVRLTELRDSNAPEFWGDPAAQKKLSELEAKFGPMKGLSAEDAVGNPAEGPVGASLLDAANVGTPGDVGGSLPAATPIPSDFSLLNAAGPA